MGGKSTLRSALLGGQKVSTPSAFDLRSWQGLTQVLKVGKDSLKDPVVYAEFRNLVLEYAQKGGDAELRTKIDVVVATFSPKKVETENIPMKEGVQNVESLVPTPPEKVEREEKLSEVQTVPVPEESKSAPIGRYRLAPRFDVTVEETMSEVVPQTEVSTAVADVEVSEVPFENVFEPVIEISETPQKEEVAVTPAPFKSLEEHKVRITEIKREVNAKIGNPATLIDTDNNLGKQYMTALLTALKATGAGQSNGVDEAMHNLEDAYTALLGHIKEEAPQPIIEKEIPPLDILETPVVPEEVVSPQQENRVFPEVKASTQEVEVPIEIPVPAPVSSVAEPVPLQEVRVLDTIIAPTPLVVPETMVDPIQKQSIRVAGVTLKDIEMSHVAHRNEVTENQIGLDAPQITEALHQLLHDWSIFSGSGLFGTGPGGFEHPIYRKLVSLSMGEVLAGRWEGSNPKTIKVIKEYVDAWRHEQGVSYTLNETFEHYLRRVIQRILKRQE